MFASQPFIPWLTGASVAVDFINASGFVKARTWCTFINVLLAGGTRETRMASASKSVHPIQTDALAVARFRGAVVDVDVACCSLETHGA